MKTKQYIICASLVFINACTSLPQFEIKSDASKSFLENHIPIEEATNNKPFISGNKVILLKDGPETYEAMFLAIHGAKDNINLETYIFTDDYVGQEFADLLIRKQKAGIQVNIIYDSVGSIRTPNSFFKQFESAGINTVEFNPINPFRVKDKWIINNRDHRKQLIVDGRIVIIGGINISSIYSEKFYSKRSRRKEASWRDTDIQVEGPAVVQFQQDFFETWERQGGKSLSKEKYFPKLKAVGNDKVHVTESIGGTENNPIYFTLLSAILNAKSSIKITSAYFIPEPQFLEAIKTAAKKVDVQIILPSHSDSWITLYTGRSYYSELLKAGVKIYERRDALLHAKTIVVDNVWSYVGSTNLDYRSFLHNDELNASVISNNFTNEMRKMFVEDLKKSNKINLEEWEKRSPVERAKEQFARIFKYWL